MKIGIIISTYQKQNGTTPSLLNRALKSIKNQTHTDYKVFLIGDKYEDNAEFIKLAIGIIDINKIYYENLSKAVEREKYSIGSSQLWCAGGVNATNYGIDIAISEGIENICHLDHDDYWDSTHLETINEVLDSTDSSFVYTCSTYMNNGVLPNVELNGDVEKKIPNACNLIHSSVCMNFKKIPLRYRDVYAETGSPSPADADLWSRVYKYITDYNLNSFLIKKLTCYHPTEKI